MESHNNKHVEDSQRVHTSANSHHLETLPVTNNVHMSAQPTTGSFQQKLTSKGCSLPSWSFQSDTTDILNRCDTDSGQAFLASTKSISKPDGTVGVTMIHPVTSKPSMSSHHPYEDVDLDHRKEEEASLEQSEQYNTIQIHNTIIYNRSVCKYRCVPYLCKFTLYS